VLLAIDFDGTLTDHDTLDLICQAFAPEAWREADEELHSGRWTLEQVIEHEFASVTATREEILAFVRDRVSLRPGLPALLATCVERFVEPVVVSSGFTSLIVPVLIDHGIDLPVIAHDAVFTREGASVAFRTRTDCGSCGERCKRDDVVRRADGRTIGYVGDGWSDRCAALAADLVFARAGLARYLDDEGVAYRPFEDFDDVREGLVAYLDGR
jgi:HAD superfamily phosphoserine phosphatase-like hydrolase